MRSEMYTFTDSIGKTFSGLHLQQQLLRDLLKTSCTGGEEAEVWSRRVQYLALVFGMKLNADIPGVIFQFNNLHALARVVLADEIESSLLQPVHIVRVHFVAMSVALFDHIRISI
jgi:hypothetical protein